MNSMDTLYRLVNGRPLIEDTFEDGAVVQWTQSGYLYAAIKTPDGWVTTAGESNRADPQIPRVTDIANLAALLSLDKVTFVAVSVAGMVLKGDVPCGS